jgi:hypothetical protein
MSEQVQVTVQAQPKTVRGSSEKGSIMQRVAVNTAPINDVPSVVHEVLGSPGQPLDPDTQKYMESRFGYDFSGVRIHTDAKAAESANSVKARAYTVGKDVAFGLGQYTPGTIRGKHLLSHELTHVVQQRFAPAGPLQLAGGPINISLEQEAERVAGRITQPERERTTTALIGPISSAPAILSRAEDAQASAGDVNQVQDEAKVDARRIRAIFLDNTVYLDSGNERDIMAIVKKWADKPVNVTHTRVTAFDLFIVALGAASFDVSHYLVSQNTTAFDQIYRRLDSNNVEQVKTWVRTRGQTFRDAQPNKEINPELTKEDVIKGVKLAGDVAAAGVEVAGDAVSGGAATLLAVVNWLVNDLPQLYNQVKSVIDFVETIRALKFDDVKKLFTATGIADLMVKALFGEVQPLPSIEKEEEDKGEDAGDNVESKGLVKFFHTVMKIIKAVKKAYSKVIGFVDSILSKINITRYSWFKPFSMIYAGIVHIIDIASNPGAALGSAVAKIQEQLGNFFGGLKTKVAETAGEIKEQVNIIGSPAKLISKLADKAVEMVLNFVLTHPPSPVLKLAAKIVEALAGDTIIGILRKKIPSVVDEMIKKIAESDIVKKITHPLEGPVESLRGAITNVSTKAQDTITSVEGKATGLLGDGVQMVKELTGIDPLKPKPPENVSPDDEKKAEEKKAQPAAKGSAASDFFGVIKSGIHTRLLAIGEKELLQAGKDLGKAAVKKGVEGLKKAGGKIKELILGPKIPFDVHKEHHELWVEEQGEDITVYVASAKTKLEQRLALYNKELTHLQDPKTKSNATGLISQLTNLNNKIKTTAKQNSKAIEADKKQAAELVKQLEILMPLVTRTVERLQIQTISGISNDEKLVLEKLSEAAWTRVLDYASKGKTQVDSVKGKIAEELVSHTPEHNDAMQRAQATAQKEGISVKNVEFVRDIFGQVYDQKSKRYEDKELTDGMILAVLGNSVRIFTVYESKSPRNIGELAHKRSKGGTEFLGQIGGDFERMQELPTRVKGKLYQPKQIIVSRHSTEWLSVAPPNFELGTKRAQAIREGMSSYQQFEGPVRDPILKEVAKRVLDLFKV